MLRHMLFVGLIACMSSTAFAGTCNLLLESLLDSFSPLHKARRLAAFTGGADSQQGQEALAIIKEFSKESAEVSTSDDKSKGAVPYKGVYYAGRKAIDRINFPTYQKLRNVFGPDSVIRLVYDGSCGQWVPSPDALASGDAPSILLITKGLVTLKKGDKVVELDDFVAGTETGQTLITHTFFDQNVYINKKCESNLAPGGAWNGYDTWHMRTVTGSESNAFATKHDLVAGRPNRRLYRSADGRVMIAQSYRVDEFGKETLLQKEILVIVDHPVHGRYLEVAVLKEREHKETITTEEEREAERTTCLSCHAPRAKVTPPRLTKKTQDDLKLSRLASQLKDDKKLGKIVVERE